MSSLRHVNGSDYLKYHSIVLSVLINRKRADIDTIQVVRDGIGSVTALFSISYDALRSVFLAGGESAVSVNR